ARNLNELVQDQSQLLHYHKGPLLYGKISVNLIWYGHFKPSQKVVINVFFTSLCSPSCSQPQTTSPYMGSSQKSLGRVSPHANNYSSIPLHEFHIQPSISVALSVILSNHKSSNEPFFLLKSPPRHSITSLPPPSQHSITATLSFNNKQPIATLPLQHHNPLLQSKSHRGVLVKETVIEKETFEAKRSDMFLYSNDGDGNCDDDVSSVRVRLENMIREAHDSVCNAVKLLMMVGSLEKMFGLDRVVKETLEAERPDKFLRSGDNDGNHDGSVSSVRVRFEKMIREAADNVCNVIEVIDGG
ncbi:hypothetical protein RYX36_007527, partial [Vicia faba]